VKKNDLSVGRFALSYGACVRNQMSIRASLGPHTDVVMPRAGSSTGQVDGLGGLRGGAEGADTSVACNCNCAVS
jgi:hypothetical protein